MSILQEGTNSFEGSSPKANEIRYFAMRAGAIEHTILLLGPTGVGKGTVAQLIHEVKGTGPFVTVDCGALTESLSESELFGHTQGAFTGAVKDRIGLIGSSNGGTLFFDEVQNLPPSLQPK